MSDVVSAAGVSQALVYSFLSGKYYGTGQANVGISQDNQRRIIEACRRVGYQPTNPETRNRVYPELGEFGFLLSNLVADGVSNAYFGPMMEGASSIAADRPIAYSPFQDAVDYLVAPDQLPPPVKTGRANKFLVGGPINYSLLHALLGQGARVVYLSRFVQLPGVLSVVPDYIRAAQLALDHLFALGHRHVAVVAEHYYQPHAYNTRQLIEGVSSAMLAQGLAFAESDVLFKARSGPEKVSSVMPRLLARSPRPTAVFCFDDWTAKCMLQAAADAGLRVPADLSIIGVNDDRTAAYMTPPLSTVRLPMFDIGRRAAAELDRLAREEDAGNEPRRIVMPVELVTRESTAPAPTR